MIINGVEFNYKNINDKEYMNNYIEEVTQKGLKISTGDILNLKVTMNGDNKDNNNKCFKCGYMGHTNITYKDSLYICRQCHNIYTLLDCSICELRLTPSDATTHARDATHINNVIKHVNILRNRKDNKSDNNNNNMFDSSDSSDSSEDDKDDREYMSIEDSTDDSTDDEEEAILTTRDIYKRVKIATKGTTMEEHEAHVRKFNKAYGTEEKGNNGGINDYWTNGELVYNLKYKPSLYNLYKSKGKSAHLDKCVNVAFMDPPEDDDDNYLKPIKQQTINETLNELKAEIKRDGYININNKKLYDVIYNECKYIRDHLYYNLRTDPTNGQLKKGDIVYYNDGKYLKMFVFYEVLTVTEKKIKCRPLCPIVTVKFRHGLYTDRAQLYKYMRGAYAEHLKDRTFNKSSFSMIYNTKDFLLYVL